VGVRLKSFAFVVEKPKLFLPIKGACLPLIALFGRQGRRV